MSLETDSATSPTPPAYAAGATATAGSMVSLTGRRLRVTEEPEFLRASEEIAALCESALQLRRLAEALRSEAPTSEARRRSNPAVAPPSGLRRAFETAASALMEETGSEGGELRTGRRTERMEAALGAFHSRLTDWTRERWASAPSGVAPLYLEGQLRAAVLTGPPSPGPYLHPLVLDSYDHYSEFCRRHDFDPSQLHRVLHGEASISLSRLTPILADFAGHGPRRTSYELRVVPVDDVLSMCRADPDSPAAPVVDPRRLGVGVDLDTFCRQVLAKISAGGPTALPPGAYARSYVLRVLRRKTPGSFRFFSLLTFPDHALVPRRLHTAGPVDVREGGIDFASGW